MSAPKAVSPAAPPTSQGLMSIDAALDKLGMRLYEAGDKEGWSICDDLGHRLRDLAAAEPSPKCSASASLDAPNNVDSGRTTVTRLGQLGADDHTVSLSPDAASLDEAVCKHETKSYQHCYECAAEKERLDEAVRVVDAALIQGTKHVAEWLSADNPEHATDEITILRDAIIDALVKMVRAPESRVAASEAAALQSAKREEAEWWNANHGAQHDGNWKVRARERIAELRDALVRKGLLK